GRRARGRTRGGLGRGGGPRVDAWPRRRRVPGSHLHPLLCRRPEARDRRQRRRRRHQLGRRLDGPPPLPLHQPAPGDAAPGHDRRRGDRRRDRRRPRRPPPDQRPLRRRARLRGRLDGPWRRSPGGWPASRGGARHRRRRRRIGGARRGLPRPGVGRDGSLPPVPGPAGAQRQRARRRALGRARDRRRRGPGPGDEPADGRAGQGRRRDELVHGRLRGRGDRRGLLRPWRDRPPGRRAGDGRHLPRVPDRLPPHPPRADRAPGGALRADPALPGRLAAAPGVRDHRAGPTV
ncbi:MAG: Butyryl-CoA dehydrogenase, partial [uncultured Thermomicrobiales bacterium]